MLKLTIDGVTVATETTGDEQDEAHAFHDALHALTWGDDMVEMAACRYYVVAFAALMVDRGASALAMFAAAQPVRRASYFVKADPSRPSFAEAARANGSGFYLENVS